MACFTKLLLAVVCLLAFASSLKIPLGKNVFDLSDKIEHDASNPGTIKLGGGIWKAAEYYASISVGTPPQVFEVQVDTGSSDLLIYGTGCVGCNSTVAFNSTASSTWKYTACNDSSLNCTCYTPMPQYCSFTDVYGDGSTVSGPVGTDVFKVGNLSSTVRFGFIENSNTNFEPTGVDGIWGLAYGTLSSWAGTPPFEVLVNDLKLNNSFAMCLGESGGELELGVDYSKDPAFQWTKITDELWYVVKMSDIKVDKKSLQFTNSSAFQYTIVDSGTTLLIVPEIVFTNLQLAFLDKCTLKHLPGVCGVLSGLGLFDGYCFAMTEHQRNSFPSLTFELDGVSLTIYPEDYLAPQQEYWCLGIASGGPNGFTILGDVVMQRFKTVFDIKNSKIGFGDISLCGGKDHKDNKKWLAIGLGIGGGVLALIIIIVIIVVVVKKRRTHEYSAINQY